MENFFVKEIFFGFWEKTSFQRIKNKANTKFEKGQRTPTLLL